MLGSVNSQLGLPDLERMLASVIASGHLQEHEVQTRDGRWRQLRIHPYRAASGKVAAAVLVLLDIDEIRRARQNLRDARDYALAIIETVRDPLVVLDADLRLQTANEAFYRMFNIDKARVEHEIFYKMGGGVFDIPDLRDLLEKILPEKSVMNDFEMTLQATKKAVPAPCF